MPLFQEMVLCPFFSFSFVSTVRFFFVKDLWFDILLIGSNSKLLQRLALPLPTFGDFLESLINQKEMISSDVKFLPTYMTSILGSSSNDLLVPESIHDRFLLLFPYNYNWWKTKSRVTWNVHSLLLSVSVAFCGFRFSLSMIFTVYSSRSMCLEGNELC